MSLTDLWPSAIDPLTRRPHKRGWEVVAVDTMDPWYVLSDERVSEKIPSLQERLVTRFIDGSMYTLKGGTPRRVLLDTEEWARRPGDGHLR